VLPFISDFGKWTDLASASKKNMLSLMKRGTNLAMIPGGFQEATLYERGRHRVYIKDRKGFVKYALQYGYKVVPCYAFGEEFSYWQLSFGKSFGLWLNKYNLPGVLFVGKFFSFMPDYNMDFTVVVGKALDFPHLPEPTDDDVERYHGIYVKALSDLFERNKGKYAQPGATLEVL
jgi:2-acylglycerol O-acyltransferase 2